MNEEDERWYSTNVIPNTVISSEKEKKEFVDIEIELEEKLFIIIALTAHQEGITLNDLLVKLLEMHFM